MTRAEKVAGRRTGGGVRLTDLVLGAAILVLLAVVVARVETASAIRMDGRATVNDGDTLTVAGERMRLRGIDAPEFGQTCKGGDGTAYDCGRRARQALADAIDGRPVACTGHERDRYGRLLVECSVGGADLNAAMVRDGWALAFGGYVSEEDAARRERRGVWAGEFERPRDWRVRRGDMLEAEHLMPGSLTRLLRGLAGLLWTDVRTEDGNTDEAV